MLLGLGPYGGSELRAWRLARHLAAEGSCDVSMLAFDYGQARRSIRDGVAFRRDSSYVLSRSLWARLRGRAFRGIHVGTESGLDLAVWEVKAWQTAAARVYVAFGVTNYTANLARWCAASNRRFVLLLGSDMDLDPAEPGARALYDQPGLLLTQTEYQREEVLVRFNRKADVLRNPVVIPPCGDIERPREFALWVGKSDRIKCPERMIELARLCPELPITMIMNRADAALFDTLKAQAPPNVHIVDAVRPDRMRDYYSRAFALVSTSRIEGFANSFLEAGACGTPVLSMNVDPDGFISAHGGGILEGDVGKAAAQMHRLHDARHWAPGSLGRTLGEAAYRYVSARHESGIILAQFSDLIVQELSMAA